MQPTDINKSSFIWVLKSNHITSERSNQKLIDFILQRTWKTKFLGTSSGVGLGSYHIHIVMTFRSQLPATSGIFCLFVKVVYLTLWLEIHVPNNKFGFSGDNY